MKKTAVKKATVKIVNVKSKVSENQQDFNKVVEVTEKLKKELKQFKNKVMAFDSYLKPHISENNSFSLSNILGKGLEVKIVQLKEGAAEIDHFFEECMPRNIDTVSFAFNLTIKHMVNHFGGMMKETEKKIKDTQLFLNKYPEKNREILRKIIIIELEKEKMEVLMSHTMNELKTMEKDADKLIIKKNKEEHKKGKGSKIIKLLN